MFSFLFVKDRIASFQLKHIVVFWSVPCAYLSGLFYGVIAIEFDFWITKDKRESLLQKISSEYCILLTVKTLNMNDNKKE